MSQAEDRDNVLDKPTLVDLEARQGDRAEGNGHRERLNETDQFVEINKMVCDSPSSENK